MRSGCDWDVDNSIILRPAADDDEARKWNESFPEHEFYWNVVHFRLKHPRRRRSYLTQPRWFLRGGAYGGWDLPDNEWRRDVDSAFFSQTLSPNGSLARSPAAPGTIYATITDTSVFYRSTDDGITWNSPGIGPRAFQGILADPVTAATVYVFGVSTQVSKSTDGGATWNTTSTGLPQ